MIIKMKSKEELYRISYQPSVSKSECWHSEAEYKQFNEVNTYKITKKFARMFDEYDTKLGTEMFGVIICNQGETENNFTYSDEDFKTIFGWAGEVITKETHPEYFL